ncbi:MAG TPA: SMP-30/gluconolactonase/LRE family protein [Burkholderiales bacterium]|nr:SMP-30/gluconolactonase/LRE family protein [Burkholderiales bacterium]
MLARSLLPAAALLLASHAYAAQDPVALAGTVSSAEEGAMEGVLVNAKKADSNRTVTVVTDASGRYEFPAKYLEPGKYTIGIRAAGYDLPAQATADVTGKSAASADLKLVKTRNLAAQLSNGEWLYSAPGTAEQKRPLLSCVGCHTLNRITMSAHNADGFVDTIKRMGTYANQSTYIRPQKRLTGRDTDLVGEDREKLQRAQAEYFSTINQSAKGGNGWTYELKTLPRPSGRGTRVVITEWDLPRPTIQPHDVIVDANGIAWYCDFGDQKIGTLDPKTGKVVEIALPELKKGSPNGSLSARFDRDGNIWLGMMYQAAIGKYDLKSGKLETWVAPPQWNRPNTQINMTSPMNMGVDGKIWAQNNGFAGVHRIDLRTGQWETWEPYKAAPVGHNIYDVISDSKNNGWFTDIGRETIGRIDAKTGEVKLYSTPTKSSGPRRGMMDTQDRIWFAQYRGNRIAMFDTRTEQFKEWAVPSPWTQPYDVAIDRNGEAWTGSMLNDRIVRLNTQSGQAVEYLLPRTSVNIRRVWVDNSTNPVSFWVGSNHGASIIRVEPQD